ncbi:MAG TPA: class A beta-lactamase [Candidatus Elarobacter sp.]|nr:class A beta-lactamase [Candidatus Elarobacter sp.]
MDRATFVSSLAATGATPLAAVPPLHERTAPSAQPFAREEAMGRGRLGVCAIALHDDRRLARRERERFPLASTFKLPLVMAVLARVDRGIERLDRKLAFRAGEILPYSPAEARFPRGGSLTIAELCAAAIEQSDNTAANLLMATLGGPAGVTSYVRGLGDSVTRLDRTEPALNTTAPGDPRDTTTPFAMASLLARLVRDPILSPASKARLFGWMRNARTGLTRIRAGVPPGWTAGDKTGTTNTAGNDVAILWPRTGAPIVLAVYFAEVHAADETRDAAIASVAREVIRRFRD